MRGNGKLTRTWMAMIGVCGMALAAPIAADAAVGTAGVTAGTLRLQAGPGTTNDMGVFRDNDPKNTSIEVFEGAVGGSVLPATGCQAVLPNFVVCAPGPIVRISVAAGDLDDVVSLTPTAAQVNLAATTLPARISGGPGNDKLTAGDGPDVILGGTGINIARGMGGNDRLLMRNGVRDTLIDCGPGTADTAVIDKIDPRPIACERVLRPT